VLYTIDIPYLFYTHILVLSVSFMNNFLKLHGIPEYANVSCVLYLIKLFSNEWPDDGPLQGRNM
jgi:hypothetical protein